MEPVGRRSTVARTQFVLAVAERLYWTSRKVCTRSAKELTNNTFSREVPDIDVNVTAQLFRATRREVSVTLARGTRSLHRDRRLGS